MCGPKRGVGASTGDSIATSRKWRRRTPKCGFRLYVERENSAAQAAYAALGMKETRYFVFEELKPGVRFYR